MSNIKEKLNLVVFGFNDWETWLAGGFSTRCAKLVKLLAERPEIGKIVVVSTPKSIFTKFWRALLGRSRYTGAYLSKGTWFSLRQVEKNIYCLDHFRVFPRNESSDFLFKLNSLIHAKSLRTRIMKAAKELRLDNYILWLANPLMVEHVGRLGESLSIFDAIDDWRAHPQKQGIRKTLIQAYDRISEKVDIVLTVSEHLKDKLSTGRTNVHWLPNGIDVAFFSAPRPAPTDIDRLPRPIFEYIGRLQERVDVELIEDIALAMPQASVALIGPVVAPKHFRKLKTLGNVHFLGPKKHADIPAFIQHADVCIMPHHVNDFTRSMNPLKLYEYIAAGKQVVATEIAGLEGFKNMVYLAPDRKAFISKLKELTASAHIEDMKKSRATFLSSCDWQVRLELLFQIILQPQAVDTAQTGDKAQKSAAERTACAN